MMRMRKKWWHAVSVYPFFFFLLSLLFGALAWHTQPLFAVITGWVALSCMIMAAAYTLGRSEWIMGKQPDGKINRVLVGCNLPWLLFTWLTFVLYRLGSREAQYNHIGTTGWTIGCYPGTRYQCENYDLIIDLTAEFPRPGSGAGRYHCLPNLDGVVLKYISLPFPIRSHHRIFIHCAQGHGRSATWAALALVRYKVLPDVDTAMEAILQARPKARPSKAQRLQIQRSTPGSCSRAAIEGTGGEGDSL